MVVVIAVPSEKTTNPLPNPRFRPSLSYVSMRIIPALSLRINRSLSELADGRKIRYLNINDKLADGDGTLLGGMMNASDKLHPTVKAYQVWADALKPILTELLGPPAAVDHAPPPTGDPAAGH
jgi:hypothetical protein